MSNFVENTHNCNFFSHEFMLQVYEFCFAKVLLYFVGYPMELSAYKFVKSTFQITHFSDASYENLQVDT